MADIAYIPATKSFQDATPLLADPQALRKQAEEQGYLYFKQLLNPQKLTEVRLKILEILNRRGLLDAQQPIEAGIADVKAINALDEEMAKMFGVPNDLYGEIQELEDFHALAHTPALLDVFRLLFDEEVFPHPRNIARVVVPHRSVKPTPPHQDFVHIQGTKNTWTVWFPLSACPRELGGLSMLEKSHKLDILNVASHPNGAGGLEAILCDLDYEWAEGDYQLGDLIMFESRTVHKALPSQKLEQIRISCDFRYQPLSAEIEQLSLEPHGGSGMYKWEDLYKGWQNEYLMYYWQGEKFTFTPFDHSIRHLQDKLC